MLCLLSLRLLISDSIKLRFVASQLGEIHFIPNYWFNAVRTALVDWGLRPLRPTVNCPMSLCVFRESISSGRSHRDGLQSEADVEEEEAV